MEQKVMLTDQCHAAKPIKCWLSTDINLKRKTQIQTPQGKAMVQLMKKMSKSQSHKLESQKIRKKYTMTIENQSQGAETPPNGPTNIQVILQN